MCSSFCHSSHGIVLAAASWSTFEGTLRIICSYCMYSSFCHSSHGIVLAAASWSTFEGTLRILCSYCMYSSFCHSSHGIVPATASWSTIEGTLRILCSYCMCSSFCHSSCRVHLNMLQLAIATFGAAFYETYIAGQRNLVVYSYTPRTLRACSSQSKFRILKICESSARALFLYNCTPNISRSADASVSVA